MGSLFALSNQSKSQQQRGYNIFCLTTYETKLTFCYSVMYFQKLLLRPHNAPLASAGAAQSAVTIAF